jgi:uncharacterized protein YecT (DUF1311 family)
MRSRSTLLAGIAALILATGTAHATDDLKPHELFQKLYQGCEEQDVMPGPIAACLFEKEEAFGRELEQVYNKAVALAGTNNTLLRESQRSWLKYQESDCKLHEVWSSVEGSVYGRNAKAQCLLTMTLQRLQDLRQIVIFLETYGPVR